MALSRVFFSIKKNNISHYCEYKTKQRKVPLAANCFPRGRYDSSKAGVGILLFDRLLERSYFFLLSSIFEFGNHRI
jgi:hypothetical protein